MAKVLEFSSAPNRNLIYQRLHTELYRQESYADQGLSLEQLIAKSEKDVARVLHLPHWWSDEEAAGDVLPPDWRMQPVDYDGNHLLVQKARLLQMSPSREFAGFYEEARAKQLEAPYLAAGLRHFWNSLKHLHWCREKRISVNYFTDEERYHYHWIMCLAEHRWGKISTEELLKQESLQKGLVHRWYKRKEQEEQARRRAEEQQSKTANGLIRDGRERLAQLLRAAADWIQPYEKV